MLTACIQLMIYALKRNMDLGYSIIRPFLLVHCVGVVLSASYYQREYAGYLFTIPGFNYAEQRSQVDAQSWCNQNGSKLLAITNPIIQNAAVAFINETIRENQMTGNPIITDGKRLDGGWTWINQTTMTQLSIEGQEGGPSTTYAYLYLPPSPSLTLFADIPSNKRYFICEGQVFCESGYLIHGQCFQRIRDDNQKLSWFEARNLCLQKGGDLATFEFITTKDGLTALNGSWLNQSSDYWIGLRRQWWTWQSINSTVTYSLWLDGHPIYDFYRQCLCLWPSDWKWSECECGVAYQFVCISSPDVTTTSQSTVSTTFSSTASSSSASIDSTTPPHPSPIEMSTPKDSNTSALAIGLGVGLGLPFVVIVIIVVLILLSRKGCISFKRQRAIAKESPAHSDVTPLEPMAAIYVDVVRNGEKGTKDLESEEKNADEQIQYAEFQIINNKTPQTELDFKNNVSISSSKRMTMVPPNSAKLSEDNDAVEYGEVNKTNRPPFE